ncbi:MAG TPA: serine/threonine-protein kinase, partial [Povalibacter sp.]|nr:serine/threonine-protein kinase [Povalibacter sp.]
MNSRPQRLGKYQIRSVLGRGAMGVVYKAFDPDIRRTIAIKTFGRAASAGDSREQLFTGRFRTEAQAAGKLMHPGIVQVYEYGEQPDFAYIAMEFVEGSSLREYMTHDASFSEHDMVSLMVQLLDALAHAHANGVWHRDIKPANLLIASDGRLKIADFGISRHEHSELTQVGVIMGTPGYMPPE